MARLNHMPNESVVQGLKGSLDFYYWFGMPVVRKWPRVGKYTPSAQELQARENFRDNIKALGAMPAEAITSVPPFLLNNGWTWRDAWMASIYGNG